MHIVIIGAGPAGVSVAETLRAQGYREAITVLSAEPTPPYSPPAMVDHFLTGSDVHLWRGRDWPERLGLTYRSGTAVAAVDPDAHTVRLTSGEVLRYDRLVLAAGSRLYAPVEGSEQEGVYNFKSLSAAEALIARARAGEARTALIVGAGFIGVEIALLLQALGLQVTQIEMLDRVIPRMLDAETAGMVAEVMRERGVDLRLNTQARRFIGNGRAQGVELESGEVLRADILIAATGIKPNVEFLAGSGIETHWGVIVDDYLRTNAPDIYAAGDIAEVHDRLTGERYVHAIFPNAVAQGQCVALNLLGWKVLYEGAESMNSLKHLGLPVVAVGAQSGAEILRLRRGSTLRQIVLDEGRIVGFRLVGDTRQAGLLRSLMLRRVDVRPLRDLLLDPRLGVGILVGQALTGV
jgi:nitrite reductase (NADH) large subunit